VGAAAVVRSRPDWLASACTGEPLLRLCEKPTTGPPNMPPGLRNHKWELLTASYYFPNLPRGFRLRMTRDVTNDVDDSYTIFDEFKHGPSNGLNTLKVHEALHCAILVSVVRRESPHSITLYASGLVC